MPTSPQSIRPRISPALGTLLLLIGLNLFNYIDRYILPGEVSLIQREFHSTDQQMGALTTALFIFYMLAAPLTGWLGDHFRRKPLIIAGAVLWSLATLGTYWVHSYWMLYARQALVGVGEATFGIFAPAVLADFYPERDRNRILSIFYVAIPVGAALGYVAGGELGSPWGWRQPFFLCAIPGLVIAALYAWIGREPSAEPATTCGPPPIAPPSLASSATQPFSPQPSAWQLSRSRWAASRHGCRHSFTVQPASPSAIPAW